MDKNGKDKVSNFLIEALIETDPNNKNRLYLPYTVEMIVLAFIYKKIGQSRSDIKYFVTIQEGLNC